MKLTSGAIADGRAQCDGEYDRRSRVVEDLCRYCDGGNKRCHLVCLANDSSCVMWKRVRELEVMCDIDTVLGAGCLCRHGGQCPQVNRASRGGGGGARRSTEGVSSASQEQKSILATQQYENNYQVQIMQDYPFLTSLVSKFTSIDNSPSFAVDGCLRAPHARSHRWPGATPKRGTHRPAL